MYVARGGAILLSVRNNLEVRTPIKVRPNACKGWTMIRRHIRLRS